MTDHTISEDRLSELLRADTDGAGTVHLVGLADGALCLARRRSRARAGVVGLAVAAVAATSIGWIGGTHLAGPAAGTGTVRPALQISFLPVVSEKPGPCPAGGGYPSADRVEPVTCYQLDRAAGLTPTASRAVATRSQVTDVWQIEVTLYGRDVPAFAALTAAAADRNSAPGNELAVVVDGRVVSAPRVSTSITGGQLQVTGDFTQQSAADLAKRLNGR